MRLADFDYELPGKLVAQRPLAERDASRLLLLDRKMDSLQDRSFRELPRLLSGDELIVLNNTRVFPARLFGRRRGVHAEPLGPRSRIRRQYLSAPIEVLLLRPLEDPQSWEALVRPGRKVRTGELLELADGELEAEVLSRAAYGLRVLRFCSVSNLPDILGRRGHVPLPPYIDRPDEPADHERYQTVFARAWGAVAAPTAGLHFTSRILSELATRNIAIVEITLTIGLGTFQPIHARTVETHRMHAEPYEISSEAARAIAAAQAAGRPILAVGTSVVRALESAASRHGEVLPGRGQADLFIYPGYQFKVVSQLLTNFHLPRSSLLLLVSAFAGRETILRAYHHAVKEKYRFYSYGDCMLIR
jgi:S-adenosylmethionine:tRNA ribosyltransferase-isomerase